MKEIGRADFTGLDRLAHTQKVGIEAAIETHLQLDSGGCNRGEGAVDFLQAERNGFFAKDVLAGLGSGHDQVGMGIGRRANGHRVDGRVGDNLGAGGDNFRNIAAGSNRLRGGLLQVRDGGEPCAGHAEGKAFSMHRADASCADQSKTKFVFHWVLFYG